jgi:protease-4
MKSFFKYVFATILGIIFTSVICSIVCIFVLLGIAAGLQETSKPVKSNSVISISLSETVPDKVNSDFNNFDFSTMKMKQILGLNDILKTIERAKNDVNIVGIYLDLSSMGTGAAQLEEIRNKLLEFKESKKFILAYSNGYSQNAYYLATVADKIYLNPQGSVNWQGASYQVPFFKNLLEKIGVEMQIFRHGQYKSAIEPFTSTEMSAANKKQSIALIQGMWNNICEKVSSARGISVERLNTIADNLDCFKATNALDNKIVDGLKYYDGIIAELKSKSQNDVAKDADFLVSLYDYSKSKKSSAIKTLSDDKIAVIFAEGDIVDGNNGKNQIAGDDLAKTIRKIREDKNVKAVVLRINSPGGSGLASEIIWREVSLTKAVKPVVVSMGNYAASGGYYIACPANYIFAQPSTITGSIGVFGMLPNTQKLMNNHLGINFDGVKTNDKADFYDSSRPVTEPEAIIMQNSIEDFYNTFITRVSDGRGIAKADVDSIGQGRVWSGIDAIKIKLVDELGGLNDALNKAIELAGIKDNNYILREYPEKEDFFTTLFSGVSTKIYEDKMKETLGDTYKFYQTVERVKTMTGIQARLEYDIIIK